MNNCSLLIKEPDGKKRVVPLERPVLSFGRAPENDVRSATLSRHCPMPPNPTLCVKRI